MIQRASQVLDCISKNEGKSRWGMVASSQMIDWFSCLRITLTDDHVGLRTEETANVRFQVLDMLVGPFDFKPKKLSPSVHAERR
jgi:hypothetical protein